MSLPKLTTYQTLENSHGTLDPLGLYSIADSLARRLTPDLRERMKHPRYLTAMAVGAIACSRFEVDELAADEKSPPWQVYEWYVVSAFAKRFSGSASAEQLRGMPGSEKVRRAMENGIPLSANQYLKTPRVFGFHGVYRTLAEGIGLTDNDRIDEFGIQLVDIWEKEQRLHGFRVGLTDKVGFRYRKQIEDAVRSGLKAGAVARPWSWKFYPALAESLKPKSPGKNEAAEIYNKLLADETGSREQVIRFLRSTTGQSSIKLGSEKSFHTAFLKQSPACKGLLQAIQAYEKVCRLLNNAFFEILKWMDSHQHKGTITQLANLSYVKTACQTLPRAFEKTDSLLEPFSNEASNFQENFNQLRDSFEPTTWIQLLLDHHTRIQRNKPPTGKAPWILVDSSKQFHLNTNQAGLSKISTEYVHQYRSNVLLSFLKDLGKL